MEKENYIEHIKRFFRDHKRMPSYKEIMKLAGFKSRNSVFKLINKMVSMDIVGKDRSGKLIPGKSFYDIKLLGSVEAGFPSPAEEELVDTISLDDYLIENKEATYMLKVNGDSMIDAGILPGDIVLVERKSDAKNGDIVVAKVDEQWTIKYFRKKGNKIFLEPANKNYPSIFPEQDLEIAAILKAVIRKY